MDEGPGALEAGRDGGQPHDPRQPAWFLAIAGGSAASRGRRPDRARAAGPRCPRPTVRNPLYVPPTTAPQGVELTAAPATVQLGTGTSKAWVYNGSMPGPTIEAWNGETATIRLRNELPTDDHPLARDARRPRERRPPDGGDRSGPDVRLSFPIHQPGRAELVSPAPAHADRRAGRLGLAGGFIIRDAEGRAWPARRATRCRSSSATPTSTATGNIAYKPRSGGWIGAVSRSSTARATRTSTWTRPSIGSASSVARTRGSSGWRSHRRAVHADRQRRRACSRARSRSSRPTSRRRAARPHRGLPRLAVGTKVMLRDLRAGWDLLEFRVTGIGRRHASSIPTALSTIRARRTRSRRARSASTA